MAKKSSSYIVILLIVGQIILCKLKMKVFKYSHTEYRWEDNFMQIKNENWNKVSKCIF